MSGARVVAMYTINSVHLLRTHQPKSPLLSPRSQANLIHEAPAAP